jgi:S1-C subfamily serine protease
MTTGGLRLEDSPAGQRAERKLSPDALALVVSHVGEYGEHAHAKRQGFQRGDVIVAIAGETKRMDESDLFALLVNRPVGERVPVKVLRGDKQLDLSLLMQK